MSQADQKRREQDHKAQILQQQYNQYQETLTELQSQSSTLTTQIEEHRIVSNTLTKIPEEERANRKCFKMIGGVLIEKSIGEIMNILSSDIEKLQQQKATLDNETIKVKKEMEAWMKDKNVKIVRQ